MIWNKATTITKVRIFSFILFLSPLFLPRSTFSLNLGQVPSERRTWNLFLMSRLTISSRGASHVFFFQLFLYVTAARQFVLLGEWQLPSALLLPIFTSALQGTFFFWDFISKFLLGICCWSSFLYVQPTLIFQQMRKLPVILFIQSLQVLNFVVFSRQTLPWSKRSPNDFSFKWTDLFCDRLGKRPYVNPTQKRMKLVIWFMHEIYFMLYQRQVARA